MLFVFLAAKFRYDNNFYGGMLLLQKAMPDFAYILMPAT
jgi:hypothetical protein